MKTPQEWAKIANTNSKGIDYTIEQVQKEAYNQAIIDAAENATIKFIPFSDNMEVNKESILKLLK